VINSPEPVIDLIRERCSLVLRGNHDDAIFTGAEDFNPIARQALETNRRMIEPGLLKPAAKRVRWNFLKELAPSQLRGDILFVHGSPRDPIREYVMKTDCAFDPAKMKAIFEMVPRFAVGGHTHQPGVFIEGCGHRTPDEVNGRYDFGAEKAFINVGSVGQPRDGDTRSCYVIFDGKTVLFRRVEYNYKKTARKIRRIKRLPNALGMRLALGL
jgi:diadenosine tetraphosphatase ApaH/serine/threonine PP2A family protein phosphatase